MEDDWRDARSKFNWLNFVEKFLAFGKKSDDMKWVEKASKAFQDVQIREKRVRTRNLTLPSDTVSRRCEFPPQLYQQQLRMQQNFPVDPSTPLSSRPDKPHWAEIAYYELNCRVGASYLSEARDVNVVFDDPTAPYESTFCLGQLSNVHRHLKTEYIRRLIGKGVRLSCDRDAIFVECLSESAVFVQSTMYNYYWKYGPKTVHKVPPGHRFMICNSSMFLEKASLFDMGDSNTIQELKNMCTIRLSFVKGWGDGYKRPSTTELPCWMEIYLLHQLSQLDKLVAHERAKSNETTEVCRSSIH